MEQALRTHLFRVENTFYSAYPRIQISRKVGNVIVLAYQSKSKAMTLPAEAKSKRRTHRKSRLGCESCKRRKIKCDETRPRCSACIRREIDCVFPGRHSEHHDGYIASRSPSSGLAQGSNSQAASQIESASSETTATPDKSTFCSTLRFVPYTKVSGSESKLSEFPHGFEPCSKQSTKHFPTRSEQELHSRSERLLHLENTINPPKIAPPEPTNALTYADMALLHHYFNMSSDFFEKEELLQASFKCPHLLHLILSFAAIHWSRQEQHQRKSDLVAQAERHHVIGLQGAAKLLSQAEEDSMEILYKSAVLIGVYHLALGPVPGEYLGFSDHDGVASFLVFLRGVRTIREKEEEATQSPVTAILSSLKGTPLGYRNDSTGMCIPGQSLGANVGHREHLKNLRSLAQESLNDPLRAVSRDASIYLTAIDQLEPYFEEICGSLTDPAEAETASPYSRLAFGWLYRVSLGFINRLQEKSPLALAIFACFAVVLKKLETGWVVEGWPEHILSGVWKFLGPESRGLVWWPMRELGMDMSVSHQMQLDNILG
ncbi:hypothetical protein VTL71DRAFT_11368 [Oculimacula yallundae]|uniref:Zn(2)-C6 fungal-type domain-containing protein n=1 Tax=Oculimacula yallundae TaxID=86028 RepID=A0ABR4CQA5_9HELO